MERLKPLGPRPLCVDLDGTLVKSDTLVESLLLLARDRPGSLLGLPGALPHGKAAFKAYVTQHTHLDVASLPYNRKVLAFLRQEREQGRAIYLATGANHVLAERVAAHLGVFSGVLGSDDRLNLTGSRKLNAIRERFGAGGFDYIGNDTPDLPLLARAVSPMVANPTLRLRLRLRLARLQPERVFEDREGWRYSAFRRGSKPR